MNKVWTYRISWAVGLFVMVAGDSAAMPPDRSPSGGSPETYLNILDSAELARSDYESCRARGEPGVRCWEQCGIALEHYSLALRESLHAEIRPLRAGRELALRCKADLEQTGLLVGCLPGAPTSAHAVCEYIYVDFDLDRRRSRLELLPRPIEWWEPFVRADAASRQSKHELAATSFEQAYDRCERSSYDGAQRCLPLVREALHSRRMSYAGMASRRGIEASLRLVDRALRADDRACQQSNSPIVAQICVLQQDLLLLHGELLHDAGQFRSAADQYERAYSSCIHRGEPAPDCWRGYGRPAWRARQRLLSGAASIDPEQKMRATVLLNQFLHDVQARCEDPTRAADVESVCHDLDLLAAWKQREEQPPRETPRFIAAVAAGDLLRNPLSGCPAGSALVECWPTLRSVTLDRTEQIRRSSDAEERDQLLAASDRDLQTFLRHTRVDCTQIDPSPAARACGLSEEIRQLRHESAGVTRVSLGLPRPPASSHAIEWTSKVPRRRSLLGAGTSMVVLAGLSFAAMGAGLQLGREAAVQGRDARIDSPTERASDLRREDWFQRGELANRLVVSGAIVGAATFTVSVALFVLDSVRRRRSRRVKLAGGVRVEF